MGLLACSFARHLLQRFFLYQIGQHCTCPHGLIDEPPPSLGAFGQTRCPVHAGVLVFPNVHGGKSIEGDVAAGLVWDIFAGFGIMPDHGTAGWFVPASAIAPARLLRLFRHNVLFLPLGRFFRYIFAARAAAFTAFAGRDL